MKSLSVTRNPRILTTLVFLFSFSIMLSSSGGPHDVWDGKGYFLLTENLVKHHSLVLYPDLMPPFNGDSFSVRDYFNWLHSLRYNWKPLPVDAKLEPTASLGNILFPMLGVPFYIFADEILHYSATNFTYYFLNPLILSLICTIVFVFGSELYNSKKIGFALSLIAGVGSFAWADVGTYLDTPITALTIISCLYFLFIASKNTLPVSRNVNVDKTQSGRIVRFSASVAGLMLGLQSFTNPGTIIVVPGIALISIYILRNDKIKLVQFLATFFFMIILQGYVNMIKFGTITQFGYGGVQSGSYGWFHSAEGLIGLLVSPGSGLLVYFPLMALLPLGVYFLWRQNRIFCIALLYVFLSVWVLYGSVPNVAAWSGYGSWGPRYMITAIPALVLIIGSILSEFPSKYKLSSAVQVGDVSVERVNVMLKISGTTVKVLFIILATAGFVTNILGVLVWYQIGFTYGFTNLHVNQLPDKIHYYKYFVWYQKYAPLLLHWKVLTTDWWKSIRNNFPSVNGWTPCIPDNFLYCKFGIFPLIALLTITASLGLVVVNLVFDNKIYMLLRRRTSNTTIVSDKYT